MIIAKWVVCDGLPTERSEMKHYKKGVRITSIAEFEEYVEKGHRLFIIGWGSGMTRHIGFIQSLQYRFLKTNIINGKGLWVAKKIEGEKEDGCI